MGLFGFCVREEGFWNWLEEMDPWVLVISFFFDFHQWKTKGKVLKGLRGLMQGDLLSTFLFTPVADVLSRLVDKAKSANVVCGGYHVELSHLQFVDDTLF